MTESELSRTNLLVRLKWNVATHHVEEEDAEGPDSGALPVIATLPDPLRWRVHACAVKVSVRFILDESPAAKVDQLQAQRLQVDQEVLVLDVPVDDSSPPASYHCLHNLAEEVSGELFLEDALLGDEVEEVLARLGTLHHDDEGVVPLKVVQEADHPWETSKEVEEADFQGNTRGANLKEGFVRKIGI